MNWFLLNMPLAAAFFGAWVGIPLWMIVKHPDTGPSFSAGGQGAHQAPLEYLDRGPAAPAEPGR